MIRTALQTDLDDAAEIAHLTYGSRHAADFRREFTAMWTPAQRDPPTYVVSHSPGGTLLGLAGYQTSPMEWVLAEIFWVMAHPGARRAGVGTSLVHEVLRRLTAAGYAGAQLGCRTPQVGFYVSLGFTALTSYGPHHHIMWRKL